MNCLTFYNLNWFINVMFANYTFLHDFIILCRHFKLCLETLSVFVVHTKRCKHSDTCLLWDFNQLHLKRRCLFPWDFCVPSSLYICQICFMSQLSLSVILWSTWYGNAIKHIGAHPCWRTKLLRCSFVVLLWCKHDLVMWCRGMCTVVTDAAAVVWAS